MSAMAYSLSRPFGPARPRFVDLFGAEPLYAGLGVAMLLLMVPTGFAALVDERLIDGVNVWAKPLRFQFALFVYLLTLAFFARFAPASGGRLYRAFTLAVSAAIVLEMVWLMGAALLGVPAHFNPSPLGVMIYQIMGALAVFLTTASTVLAFRIWRNPETGLAPAVRDGIVLGLALVLPLTLATAGTLGGMDGHLVGDAGGATVPLMGWSREAGDLRVAHFFATHAMHFVPAFALVSAWLFGGRRRLPVWLVALAFGGFTLFTLEQALAGRPLLPV